MKKSKISFWKIFWPGFVAVLVGGLLSTALFLLLSYGLISTLFDFEESGLEVKSNTVLHVKLDGDIVEKSSRKLNGLELSFDEKIGLSDLLFGLKKAKDDSRIKGVFIELGDVSCGYSTANELRRALSDFKESGKYVVSYLSGEYVSQKAYFISSAADSIYAFPNSVMQWTGIGGEVVFFKGLLDKLDVEVEIVRGRDNDFKSAVEPFFLKKMSDSSKVQMKQFMEVIWNDLISNIASERSLEKDRLNTIADSLLIRKMDDAKKHHLVDSIVYRDEVLDILARKSGIENVKNLNFLELSKYSKNFFFDEQEGLSDQKPKIAVLIAEGEIRKDGDGISSNKLCKLLQEIRNQKEIESVVLRINSPGGSALASEEIWREIMETKKEKEIVVSMGDVAASGGYYIATPASKIFAENTTITGSIGVFGMIPYIGGFLENKIGLSFDHVSTNEHAVLSLNRKITPQELKITQEEVDDIYTQFLRRVSEGRKMDEKIVQTVARGRVWAGKDAKSIGLVDEIGGLEDAIHYLIDKNHYSSDQVLYYPLVKRNFIDKLMSFVENNKDEIEAETKGESSRWLNTLNTYVDRIRQLEQSSGIQMRMPFDLILQ